MMDNPARQPSKSHTSRLTPEQLTRKRAIDRKSQRGVRQRTTSHIQNLEAQVAMLSQAAERASYFEEQLQQMSIVLQGFKEENAYLKARMGTLSDSLSPPASTDGLSKKISTPSEQTPGSEVKIRHLEEGIGTEKSPGGFRLPKISFLLDRDSTHGTALLPAAPCIWQVVPLNTEPTCLSDRIFQDFVAKTVFSNDPLPPAEHDISPLFDALSRRGNINPLSQLAMDVISRFHDIAGIPEQISGYYITYSMLSWRIARTKRFYDLMPTWLRPLPIQLRMAHPHWMDHIPWPRARVFLIENQNSYPFEEFTSFYAPSSTVSWPYDPSYAIIRIMTPTGDPEIRMNPVFIQHMNDLRNWTVKMAFQKKYPVLTKLILEDARAWRMI